MVRFPQLWRQTPSPHNKQKDLELEEVGAHQKQANGGAAMQNFGSTRRNQHLQARVDHTLIDTSQASTLRQNKILQVPRVANRLWQGRQLCHAGKIKRLETGQIADSVWQLRQPSFSFRGCDPQCLERFRCLMSSGIAVRS